MCLCYITRIKLYDVSTNVTSDTILRFLKEIYVYAKI
jgi:hypothetical protein